MSGAALHLQGVARSFTGPPPVDALHPVDLDVEPGEYVAVVGPSGSGKSTLLNLLGLLDTPDAGRYEFDGHPVTDLSDRDRTRLRRHGIGFVFQAFHLLTHRTARENVELGGTYTGMRRGDRRTQASDVLGVVGLSARSGATPAQLSGGEQQRVAIARALMGSPRLLLADEPTGNLDSVAAAAVLSALEAANDEGITLVVVTHDPDAAARASRRVAMADGRIVEPADG